MGTAKLDVKAIVFDLDGTIVNSRDAYVEAAAAAFQATGLELPPVQVVLQIPKLLEQNLPIDELVCADKARFLDVYLKTFYSITGVKTKPIINIHAALGTLQQKVKLALITMRNVPNITLARELKQFGLAQYFAYMLTAQDTSKPKPSPEALLKALDAIGTQICDCLVVGDSVIDIKAGKAAGAKTIAVLSGLYTKQELAKLNPDLILESAIQLPDCIS
jgi:HAD superfamily hydrolase (TIGR01509 family)